MYAPMRIAHEYGVSTSGIDFLISFGIGVGIVQVFVLLAYGVFRVCVLRVSFFPDFHLRVLWWAGSGAGILWSLANMFSMVAVSCLGNAVGYSSCQASLIVSGLWGVIVFGEIRGRALIVFVLGTCCTISGIYLLLSGKS
eukprot:c18942_g1_i5.p2 GENE.c18942_g1_i5~~c18942_g1_i5.p2  ORF type:complete len:140 (+),score=26.98 c18942_g1_i5:666-1085(+)